MDVDAGAAEAARVLESRKVTIPAEIDIDAARAEMEKALISKPIHIKAIVDIDKNSLAPGILGLTTFGKNLNKIQEEFRRLRQLSGTVGSAIGQDFERAGPRIRKAITRGTAGVDRNFSLIGSTAALVAGGLGQAFVQSGRAIGKVFSGIASAGGDALSGIGSKIGGAVSSIGELASVLGAVVGPIGAVVAAVSTAVLGFAKFAVVSTLVAEAGAGIAGAWGFASTAIAAVPAAIALLGAPIAAIAIGMDGIKKAAASIKPEFDKLQKSVSATFEKGLTPILKDLAQKVFPTLKTGLNEIANSLVAVAGRTEQFLRSETGLRDMSTLFHNVSTAISEININPLLDGFLRLAGNSHALGALVITINSIGDAIQSIADNPALDKAFDGLGQVLVSVTKAFGGLVNNGIKLFAAAAPGISKGLDGITNFFSKFNWDQLGTAVGNAFKGLGDALNQIPQSTIDAIGKSFEGLGNSLNSQGFKDGVAGFAKAVPIIVDLGTKGVEAFGQIGIAVGKTADAIVEFPKDVDDVSRSIIEATHSATGLGDGLLRANEGFNEFGAIVNVADGPLADFDADVQNATPNVANFAGGIQVFGQKVQDTGGNLADFGLQLKDGVITPLDGFDPSVSAQKIQDFGQKILDSGGDLSKFGLALNDGVIVPLAKLPAQVAATVPVFTKNLAGLLTGAQAIADKIPPAILTPIDILQQKIPVPARAIGESFGTNASSSLLAAFAQLNSNVGQGFVPLVDSSKTGTENMAAAVDAAIPGLGTAFQTGFTGLGPLITTALGLLNTTVIPQGLTAMGLAFTTGFTTLIGPAVVLGFQGLTTTFQAGFLNLSATAVTPGITALGLAFTTGFTTLIGPAVILGFQNLVTTFQAGFLNLQATAITPGITALGLAFTTGFSTLIAPAVLLGFQNLTTTFQAGFLQLSGAATQGMTAVSQAVTAGFVNVTAAVNAGFVGATAAVTAGFTAMVGEADAGGVNLVTSITTTMTNFAKAVTEGGKAAVTAIKQVIADMVAAIDVNILHATGLALMQGLADGITAGSSIVQAAVKKVVADAKAAADAAAKVNSPSRLFRDGTGKSISEGLADGIALGSRWVEDEAAKVVQNAFAAANDELDTLGKLQLNAAGISDFGGRVAAQVSTAINAQAGIINLTVQSILDGQVLDERTQQALATWERRILAGTKAA